ncbi:hypothetical protein [Sinomicrobium soli]|uniref:hypothetical protein n=1 Tax=Sinomicrobium sp. N-1-3-6 TaxID=2219864 RepID=UPI000DCCBFB8|nr:hypothetical protein [Sinomicrobium sp. N-1-3-6]RAV28960.1 hypothetical protein DN748_11265 [Sinomicrobium sp. N-1-3-6]
MFFIINKIEQASHSTERLRNPKSPNSPMVLSVYRNKVRTIIYTLYTKKAAGEFRDNTTGKKIARRHWTPEMKAFARQKIAEAPKPPFVFKMTVVGWLFALFFTGVFGYLIYDSVKPPLPKPEKVVAMEQAPAVGDIYFGRYEIYREKGNPLGMEGNFGWFKILEVEGDVYHIAKSVEMSKQHKPGSQLNSTDFETGSMTPVKISEQSGYDIRFKSEDGLTEIYITDKK